MKKIKKLHLFLTLTIFILNLFFVACTAPTAQDSAQQNSAQQTPTPQGNFYTLSEAYEKGLLTIEDLQQIAGYRNKGQNSPETLDEQLANEIKEVRARNIREAPDSYFPNITAENIIIAHFYGTYNGNPVMHLSNGLQLVPGVDQNISIDIGGVIFRFGHRLYVDGLVIYEKIS